MTEGILSGLNILDFTWVMAGPYASRILADFGARVIKVQSGKTATGSESNGSAYFKAWNRNKLGITLDMSHPEARDIVLRLTAISDVVMENFSPRVMRNWGLSYDVLTEVRPDLIMVSLSATGQTGPWKNHVAFAPTVHALAGLTSMTSFPESPPLGVGYAHADAIAGLYAALLVLTALEHRNKTGQGQYVDLSEYEAMCTLMGPALMDVLANNSEAVPQGNGEEHSPAAPHGCFKCSGPDCWCVIAVFSEKEWRSLCESLGKSEWIKDKRFATMTDRMAHAKELDRLITEWTVCRDPEEVVEGLQKAGVPAGVVQNAEDLANDPHLAARCFFGQLEHPGPEKIMVDRSPIRFTAGGVSEYRAAPSLGQDNRSVYQELLGMSDDELDSLVKKGIIS
ncbi:MAG: CoA transferase [Deltaproteobacteria bacterium]|nr:CoA transferase [Deltaproteobacteria bacterium]MBW1817968.1 CoA transferase [Deltaproteobacteria bacterium]MBW2283324.1 CoA transferase [Deltaproteobacteria bacterium]